MVIYDLCHQEIDHVRTLDIDIETNLLARGIIIRELERAFLRRGRQPEENTVAC